MSFNKKESPVTFKAEIISLINQIFLKYQELEGKSKEYCFENFVEQSPANAISFRQFYRIIISSTGKRLNFLTAQFLIQIFLGIQVKHSMEAEHLLDHLDSGKIQQIILGAETKNFLEYIKKCNRTLLPIHRSKNKTEVPRSFFIKPKSILYFSLIIILPITLGIYKFVIKNPKKQEKIIYSYNLSKLEVKNVSGKVLWQKDFSPLLIGGVEPCTIQTNVRYNPYVEFTNKKQGTKVMLINPDIFNFPETYSIITDKWDNQIQWYDGDGMLIDKSSLFWQYFRAARFDFAKLSRLYLKDRGNSSFNRVEQLNGMFPESLQYILGPDKNIFWINPGRSVYFEGLKSVENKNSFFVLGYNNRLAHQFYFASVGNKDNPFRNSYYINIPNYTDVGTYDFNGYMVFLPPHLKITENQWDEKGKITFLNPFNNDLIHLYRNYKLEVQNAKGMKVYQDTPDTIKNVYRLINQAFQAKNLKRNFQNSLNLINKCLEYKIQNPYLRSILLFFKGDLLVFTGRYDSAERFLNEAVLINPQNMDSIQRLIEMKFLKGNSLEALNLLKNSKYRSLQFWGLSQGENLFQFFYYLSEGKKLSARTTMAKIIVQKPGLADTLKSIMELHCGDYDDAVKNIKISFELDKRLFTLIELRLLKARANVLSGIELDVAEFYTTDIKNHSITKSHLAEQSAYFLKTRKKASKELYDMAKDSFKKLLDLSRGDFETKLWLFYDSYIYAKTMEIYQDWKEARRGYRESISANPHTAIAKAAEIRIKLLKERIKN